ncbi:PQQ-dependent catabolism-associated CXXCW motif protein [Roseovarius autotrophicus]|uniref:PQQ-dependent catabolism-associated CXXCW motif protein n=1 Tax=Roseovarius autotrophicus TaxID=2824121 RepID=UPI0019E1443C|nr:PQQ-dependent catabolism-associated CXXCW motif protein [Roseovarius autotrophicus]MBE0454415.1 PQQ-dependent catabolism-associated CXXCW motif protein [Roseovarius sp.]
MRHAAFLAALLALSVTAVAQGVRGPEGYRMDNYRAPVPDTLPGARVLSVEEAHALWGAGAAFVDVLPRPPRPANLPAGTIWREQPRASIPGARWLPNVGYGAIAEVTEAYFKAGLEQATGGNMAKPLVIFCLAECWMSWNAAKRALEYGYTAVHWLPEGTDGWARAGYPLGMVAAEPGY